MVPVTTVKNSKKSGFEVIKNGISIFGNLSKKIYIYMFLTLARILEDFNVIICKYSSIFRIPSY